MATSGEIRARRWAPSRLSSIVEAGAVPRDTGLPGERLHHCQGRRLGAYARYKAIQRLRRALDLNRDARGIIPHPAGQVMALRQSINEGAKANALHDALHADRSSLRHHYLLHRDSAILTRQGREGFQQGNSTLVALPAWRCLTWTAFSCSA